jgi:hypothetical protein
VPSYSRVFSLGLVLLGAADGIELAPQLLDHSLQIFDGGQVFLKRNRKFAGDPIGGDTDWLLDILEGVFNYRTFVILAKEQADCRIVPSCSEDAVNS